MTALQTDGIDLTVALKALADPTRRSLFEFLCARCCPVAMDDSCDVRPVDGPTVGEVCCQITGLNHIPSRISFHLRELRLAGIITMERRGKNVVCGVRQEALDALAAYFTDKAQAGRGLNCC